MTFYRSIAFFLPAAIALTVVLGSIAALGFGLEQRMQEYRKDIQRELRMRAGQLGRMAETLLHSQPELLEKELMFIATALDASVALLIDADGRIRYAHDSRWKQDPVQQLLPHLSQQRLDQVAEGFSAELRQHPEREYIELLSPFAYPAAGADGGGQRVGFVYLARDFQADRQRVQRQELWHLLPLLLLVMVSASALSLWLHQRLARPIRALARASRRLGEDLHSRIPLKGPGEISELAQALNDMATRLSAQQDALEENLTLVRAILEQAPVAIELADPQSQRLIDANPASCQLLGYAEDERIGQNMRAFQTELAGECCDPLGKARFTTQYRRKDGSLIDVEVNLTRLTLQGEDYLLAIWHDITEQVRMQAELKRHRYHLEQEVKQRTAQLVAATRRLEESNEEQQAVFDAANSGIVLVKNGVVTRANRRIYGILGIEEGNLVGHSTAGWYLSPEDYAQMQAEAYAQILDGQPHAREQRLRRSDGTLFWTRMTGRAVDVHNPEQGVVWVIDDITEERMAAEALGQSYLEQQAIFDTAGSGIALIKEGTLMRCNRHMHEMFGWPEGSMIGQSARIWYADAEADRIAEEPYALIWAGETHWREQQLQRRDGSLFWARMAGAAVDVQDRNKGTVWVIDDITVERDAIQGMAEAKRLAESAARTKAEFLANMSHEIRTPMNAIIGMSHLLEQTELERRQRQYLKKLGASAKHLLGIINDILDLSKLEAGKMAVEQIDFDLEEVLTQVTDLISERAAAKGLELILWVEHEVPRHLLGDPLRLGQILINFSSNAVKFTDQGEISLHVSQQRRQDRRVWLRFEVSDTGIGISEEQRRCLFQQFQQADSGTTRKYGGTGLGLAISRQLAEIMGGAVGVSSSPGQGSCFWLELGFDDRSPQDKALPDPALERRRILLVVVNQHARQALSATLRGMNFDVSALADAPSALQQAQQADQAQQPYEVALIDTQLPGPGGIDLARGLQRTLKGRAPQIALLSNQEDLELVREAAEMGIHQVLAKYASPSSLWDTIAQLLGVERQTRRKSERQAGPDLSELRGAWVLLVEDNEINQDVGQELLSQAGLRVDLAENGALALERVRESQAHGGYDLVLMDMQMPVMDGLSATRAILQLPGCADLPIVALTANALQGDRERCLQAGMKGYVAKPVDPARLWEQVLAWCRRPDQTAGAGSAQDQAAREPVAGESSQAVETSTGQGLRQKLADLPGLDIDLALKQALGREKLLATVLQRFIDKQKDFAEQIDQALRSNDRRSAERLAHTLKGNCAQIALEPLRQQAEDLERSLRQAKEGPEQVQQRIRDMQLPKLIEQLQQRLPQPQPELEPETSPEDQAATQAAIAELKLDLEQNRIDSLECLHRHEAQLAQALGQDYKQLSNSVEGYDFAAALEILQKAEIRGQKTDL
ncbi:MAG: PAS domain S-box protein [Gammaproteobacteria bacterium SHHR-1]